MTISKKTITILFADNNIQFISHLSQKLQHILQDNFEINSKCILVADGEKIIDTIHSLNKNETIDLVLMNGFLPLFSAEDILIYFSKNDIQIPVLTYSNSKALGEKILSQKGNFLFAPFSLIALTNKVTLLVEKDSTPTNKNSLQSQKAFSIPKAKSNSDLVASTLRSLGFSPSLKGFSYFQEAILFGINSKKEHLPLTTAIYPHVAKTFKSNNNIERVMRYALQAAWVSHKPEISSAILDITDLSEESLSYVSQPTNGVLIHNLISKLKPYSRKK